MSKPSDTAMQAARDYYADMPNRVCTNPFCVVCSDEYERLATRIDAAAEAIVRERLVGLHKLEEEWRDKGSNVDGSRLIKAGLHYADELRDALKEFETHSISEGAANPPKEN